MVADRKKSGRTRTKSQKSSGPYHPPWERDRVLYPKREETHTPFTYLDLVFPGSNLRTSDRTQIHWNRTSWEVPI